MEAEMKQFVVLALNLFVLVAHSQSSHPRQIFTPEVIQTFAKVALPKSTAFQSLYYRALNNNFERRGSQLAVEKAGLDKRAQQKDVWFPSPSFVERVETSGAGYDVSGLGQFNKPFQPVNAINMFISQNIYNESLRLTLKLADLAKSNNEVAADAAVNSFTFTFIQRYIQIMLGKYTLDMLEGQAKYYTDLKIKIEQDSVLTVSNKTKQLAEIQLQRVTLDAQLNQQRPDLESMISNFSLFTGEKIDLESILLLRDKRREAVASVDCSSNTAPENRLRDCLYVPVDFNVDKSLALAKTTSPMLRLPQLGLDATKIQSLMKRRSWWPSINLTIGISKIFNSESLDAFTSQPTPATGILNKSVAIQVVVPLSFGIIDKHASSVLEEKIADLSYEQAVRDWQMNFSSIKSQNESSLNNIRTFDEGIAITASLIPDQIKNFDPSKATTADLKAVINTINQITPLITQDNLSRYSYLLSRFNKQLVEGSIGPKDIADLDQFMVPWPAD